jgi:hypothetical protein
MGKKFIDLTGQRFGRWTVLVLWPERYRLNGVTRDAFWLCRCTCGSEHIVMGNNLRSGKSTNCGCLKHEKARKRSTKHGMAGTRVHRIWKSMLSRCRNPNVPCFSNYGARGISVCEEWHSFENFYADMGAPPDGLTLERRNNEGDYERSNCCWATRLEQAHNRRPPRKRRRSTLEELQRYAAALGVKGI